MSTMEMLTLLLVIFAALSYIDNEMKHAVRVSLVSRARSDDSFRHDRPHFAFAQIQGNSILPLKVDAISLIDQQRASDLASDHLSCFDYTPGSLRNQALSFFVVPQNFVGFSTVTEKEKLLKST